MEPNLTPKDIAGDMDALLNQQSPNSLLITKTAATWIEDASRRPIPAMLFSEFWYEGEVCILYADTNLGKSILAVQICDSISKGTPIEGFKLTAQKQKVIYLDFELSDKQFENRYSDNYTNHYRFDNNFLRAEINPDSVIMEGGTFEEHLQLTIEHELIRTGARVVVIDNITYLRTETERAKDALPLMKHLKGLKRKYNLSILALAHTPKRDMTKPITQNDLQGSKMLINICDSAFAIGASHADKAVRYLKQIKTRNTEYVFDADNVAVFGIDKVESMLQMQFLHPGKEKDYLKYVDEKEKSELELQVKDILNNEPDITYYELAKRLCTDEYKFRSFVIKITRLVKRLQGNSNNKQH